MFRLGVGRREGLLRALKPSEEPRLKTCCSIGFQWLIFGVRGTGDTLRGNYDAVHVAFRWVVSAASLFSNKVALSVIAHVRWTLDVRSCPTFFVTLNVADDIVFVLTVVTVRNESDRSIQSLLTTER